MEIEAGGRLRSVDPLSPFHRVFHEEIQPPKAHGNHGAMDGWMKMGKPISRIARIARIERIDLRSVLEK
jgi:hypothetical protein